MFRRTVGSLGRGVFALALLALPLAACSSIGGSSSFGTGQLQVAEVPGLADYTAASALSEARSHFHNSDFGYSAAFYKRVVELEPKSADGYVGLGASYDHLRRFDLSDRVYASLYEISGGTAQYYNNVGYSYLLRGNLPAAATNFRKALRLDPDNVVIANNLQIIRNAAASARA